MNNAIPQIINAVINQIALEKLGGSIKIDMSGQLQNIKIGQSLALEFMSQNGVINVKAAVQGLGEGVAVNFVPNQKIAFPENVITPAVATVVSKTADNAEIKFVSINEQKPADFVKSNAEINVKTPAQVPEKITFLSPNEAEVFAQPLKLSQIVQKPLAESALPPQVKQQVLTELSQTEVFIKIGSAAVGEMPPTKIVTLPVLEQAVQKIAADAVDLLPPKMPPQELAQVVKNVAQTVKAEILPKLTMPLLVSTTEVSVPEKNILPLPPVIHTELGQIFPQTAVDLPAKTPIILQILEVAEVLPEKIVPENKPQILLNKIDKILAPLKNAEASNILPQISAKLPQVQSLEFVPNLLKFIKAVNHASAEELLGKELSGKIEGLGLKGAQIIGEVEHYLQAQSIRHNEWRMIEIPIFNGDVLSKINIAVKDNREEKNLKNKNIKDKIGTRFVVDTNFSKLGKFQFDGFAVAKERRFDLVIRTEQEMSADMFTHIFELFRSTLAEVDYGGNLKINVKENFIKVYQNEEHETNIADGVFI